MRIERSLDNDRLSHVTGIRHWVVGGESLSVNLPRIEGKNTLVG